MEGISNNQVEVLGRVVSKEPEFINEIHGEKFYKVNLAIERLSGVKDIIPIRISEYLLICSGIKENVTIYVEGEYQSRGQYDTNLQRNKLILFIFAREVYLVDEQEKHINQITLRGYICKPVIFRRTALKKEEIADIILAVHRSNRKSDYIPCIAWNRYARMATNFEVGTQIILYGRIQSRTYQKKLSEGCSEKRIAYEVSANKLELV